MTLTLWAEAAVIQVGWDGLLAAGGAVAAGVTAAARLVVNYLVARDKAETERREEERVERAEARLENHTQNNAILGIQKATVESLAAMNGGIVRLVDRIDRMDPDSKEHRPYPGEAKKHYPERPGGGP